MSRCDARLAERFAPFGVAIAVVTAGCSSSVGSPAGGVPSEVDAAAFADAGGGGEDAGNDQSASPPPGPDAGAELPDVAAPPPPVDDASLPPDAGVAVPPGAGTEPPSNAVLGAPLPACLATKNVTDSATLATALGAAKAGDCIVMADGAYTFPTITAKGTPESPIVVSAAHTLMATVATGNLMVANSAYVVVVGLTWTSTGTISLNNCDHCRLSRSRIMRQETGDVEWVSVDGTSTYCRVDHNDFGPQNKIGNMIQLHGVSGPGMGGGQIVQYTEIDHNFFHDVHYNGGNGWESIRAGLSGWTFSSAHTIIEQNLFKNDANDPEIVSVKSSDNVIRHNTVRASAGEISQRHGNRNQYYGNYILGDGVAGALGIRACGGDHKIFNNYIQGVSQFGIWLEGGNSTDTTGVNVDHKEGYDDTVAFNTVLSGGILLGGSHPLGPLNSTLAYNLVQGSITESGGSMGSKYTGNIVTGTAATAGAGAMNVNPQMVMMGELFVPGPGSPVFGKAAMAMQLFPYVTDDINGKPRTDPAAIGANEASEAPTLYGLLSETDVGPMAP